MYWACMGHVRYLGKRPSLDDGEGENLVAVIGMIGGIE